jgi:hypothetical protein
MEQEMHTLPEHLNSPLDVSWVRPILIFLCMFCRSFSAPLSFLAIVLSVFQVTDSDYPLGIFKLFLLIANSSMCQVYNGDNKIIFNEMMMRPALY